jgi:hypothetical protein
MFGDQLPHFIFVRCEFESLPALILFRRDATGFATPFAQRINLAMLTEYFLAASSLDMPSSQSFKIRSRKSNESARPINSSVKNRTENNTTPFTMSSQFVQFAQ